MSEYADQVANAYSAAGSPWQQPRQMQVQPLQYGAHDQTHSQPQQGPAGQPPDFLAHFLQNILGPAIAAQNQNQQGRLGLQRDAIFGRHLGMDGQPIQPAPQTPLSFGDLRRNPTDIAADERQTFGKSFSAGERVPGWSGGAGGTVTGVDPNHFTQGANPAWMTEAGGYSMLNKQTSTPQNPWSFSTMTGGLSKNQTGPRQSGQTAITDETGPRYRIF